MNRITTHPIGEKFGFWTVLGIAPNGKRGLYYSVKCECGTTRDVQRGHLLSGRSRSCGCEQVRSRTKKITKHGATIGCSKSAEYRSWSAMKARCLNPANQAYRHYGGRGISICERWLESFENFLEDMGPRPEGHTLDRVENEKGYSPQNCKWVLQKTQVRNRRNTRFLEYQGESLPLAQWAERAAVTFDTFAGRIKRGWDVERALNEPVSLLVKMDRPEESNNDN